MGPTSHSQWQSQGLSGRLALESWIGHDLALDEDDRKLLLVCRVPRAGKICALPPEGSLGVQRSFWAHWDGSQAEMAARPVEARRDLTVLSFLQPREEPTRIAIVPARVVGIAERGCGEGSLLAGGSLEKPAAIGDAMETETNEHRPAGGGVLIRCRWGRCPSPQCRDTCTPTELPCLLRRMKGKRRNPELI